MLTFALLAPLVFAGLAFVAGWLADSLLADYGDQWAVRVANQHDPNDTDTAAQVRRDIV